MHTKGPTPIPATLSAVTFCYPPRLQSERDVDAFPQSETEESFFDQALVWVGPSFKWAKNMLLCYPISVDGMWKFSPKVLGLFLVTRPGRAATRCKSASLDLSSGLCGPVTILVSLHFLILKLHWSARAPSNPRARTQTSP